MWKPRTLLITDANLGEVARDRLAGKCIDLTWESWSIDQPDTRDAILDRIAAGAWELAISFYSDLVLTQEALDAIALPLNIHPALPALRGMGYDLIPLIENHQTVGVTLHRMERRVDSGEIFRVHEARVPEERSFLSLRAFNQRMSVHMLDELCTLMDETGSLDRLSAALRERSPDPRHRWGATYHSRREIAELRRLHSGLTAE